MALLYIIGSTFLISLISMVGLLTLSMNDKLMKKIILILVAVSAGSLMGGAFLHLIPEAITGCSAEQFDMLFMNVLIGFILFFLLEKILHWRHCHDAECKIHDVKTFGQMNLIGDAVHNFIDGLIIAISFMTNISLGITASIAIASHELPQEIGDFGVLLHSGMAKRRAVLLNFITALTAMLGGLTGYFMISVAQSIVPMILPVAAGGFIYIASSDLIPELRKVDDVKKSALTFIFFILGILIMVVTKLYFA